MGVSCCRSWSAREKKHLVLQLVANEQDNCAILTPSIQVLGWIEGSLDTRFLIWHHHEDVIQLIHVHYIGLTMSVALLREGGKYYRKCKLFKSFRDVAGMSILGCHKTLTSLEFTRKNELTNSLLKKLEFVWPIRRLFQFYFSLGSYKTVHKLTN